MVEKASGKGKWRAKISLSDSCFELEKQFRLNKRPSASEQAEVAKLLNATEKQVSVGWWKPQGTSELLDRSK
jgi:hypothetical protein